MKHILLILLLLVMGSRAFASFSQGHWRWRKDDGSQTSATWWASQDFPATVFDSAAHMRLRAEVYNGLGNTETGTVGLQYQRGSGPWISVTGSSAGADFVMAGSSPFVTDGEPVTIEINDPGAGTFAGGRMLVSTYQFTDTIDAGTVKEYEWAIKATGTYSPDSLYNFEMTYTGSTNGLTYGTPIPDMMILPNTTIPGNAGIYRDSSVTGFFNRDSGWIASDGCNSVPLSDGRVLWLMDDSYINGYDTLGGFMPCLFQVRNCALVQPYNNWNWTNTSTLIGDSASVPSYLKNTSNNNYLFWPNGGYQRGDTIYAYCMNIMNSSGGLGFTSGGNDYLAKIAFPSLNVIGFDSLKNFNGITFGVGFDTAEKGNYIYTWGEKGSGFIASYIYVARFPRNNPGGQWCFWNGSAWDTSAANAAVITTGASNGTFVTKIRNKYVFVSTQFTVACNGGTQIYTETSDSLMGPFSPQKTLYTIPDNVLGNTPFFYGPVLHPEYINSKNEILLTYDINGYSNCEPFCINNGANPDYYRPRGLRVPLTLIDSTISQCDSSGAFVYPERADKGWNIFAYPNPSRSYINLNGTNCTDNAFNLLFYNGMGQCVYRERVAVNGSSFNHTIYLSQGLAKGLYVLQVQGRQSSKYVKVLVQ